MIDLFTDSVDIARDLDDDQICPATGARDDDDDDEDDAFGFHLRTGPGGSGAKTGSSRFIGFTRHSARVGFSTLSF